MSEEIETPFEEYEVEGVGTVIAPEGEPGYRVRLPDGQVTAFAAVSGAPSSENAAADIAHALANPPAIVVIHKQSSRVVLDRLTAQERAALHTARQSSAELDSFVLKAVSEGVISEAAPEFAAAVTALDAAGIIAANRWPALLA